MKEQSAKMKDGDDGDDDSDDPVASKTQCMVCAVPAGRAIPAPPQNWAAMGQRCCDGSCANLELRVKATSGNLVMPNTLLASALFSWRQFTGTDSAAEKAGPSRGPAGRLDPLRVDGAGRVPKRRKRR